MNKGESDSDEGKVGEGVRGEGESEQSVTVETCKVWTSELKRKLTWLTWAN